MAKQKQMSIINMMEKFDFNQDTIDDTIATNFENNFFDTQCKCGGDIKRDVDVDGIALNTFSCVECSFYISIEQLRDVYKNDVKVNVS